MDYAKGIEALEEAWKIDPKNIDTLYQIGMLYEKKGESEKAFAVMEDVLKRDSEYSNALNFIGYSLAEKGIKLDEAETMIKKALSKRPDDGYILDSLGWVHFKKGNYREALDELLKANQLLPDDPTIAEHVGDIYTAMNEYRLALPYYEKSVQLEKTKARKNSFRKR